MALTFKIKALASTKVLTSLSASIVFISSFLLIFFSKSDYILINQIKSVSNEIVNPITKIVSLPINITSNLVNNFNEFTHYYKEGGGLCGYSISPCYESKNQNLRVKTKFGYKIYYINN